MPRILVIDDEQASCRTLKLHFESHGFDVEIAGAAEEGLAFIKSEPIDLVISDIRMPGRDGLSLLREVRMLKPDLPVIMITAFQDLDSTVSAMQGGAVDYVSKPIDLEELEAAVEKAVNSRNGLSGDDFIVTAQDRPDAIVGRSPGMQDVFKKIGIASQNRVIVLIQGEPGTGKSAVARAIHNAGPNADEPFVTINCSSMVDSFLEGKNRGHRNDGFSGPGERRKGKVGLAGEGTLFLDEVNMLAPHLQGKLLRLMEEGEYTHNGDARPLHSGYRYILASNADLAGEVAAGRFREDLYYRLGVLSINVPPLRERREDIPLLVEQLVVRINKEAHKRIRRVSSDCMDILAAHEWPGNVRQLENVLMKAVVVSSGDSLNASLLPDDVVNGKSSAFSSADDGNGKTLKDLERDHINAVLNMTGWHKGKACKILGISRPRLDRRIEEYGFVRDK